MRRALQATARGGGALLLFLVLGWGCHPAIPRIDPSLPAFAGRSDQELSTLERGREEYIRKCSGCHGLYRPERGDPGYWGRWVGAMAKRSRLTGGEEERIRLYLLAACGKSALSFRTR